jgi:hypothetical protein
LLKKREGKQSLDFRISDHSQEREVGLSRVGLIYDLVNSLSFCRRIVVDVLLEGVEGQFIDNQILIFLVQ